MYLDADLNEPLKFLDELTAELRGPALQRAINKAAQPIVKAAKAKARAVSRDYARSLTPRNRRAAKTKHTGEAWLGIGFADITEDKRVLGIWGTTQIRKVNYSKISHLIEGGFQQGPIKKGFPKSGKVGRLKSGERGKKYRRTGGVITGFGKYVPGRPAIKPAATSGGAKFERDFEAALRREVDKAQEKAARTK